MTNNQLRFGFVLTLLAAAAACTTGEQPPPDIEGLEALASCTYVNQFSNAEECREYLGEGWTMDDAELDCTGQEDSAFAPGGCTYEENAGACVFDAGTTTVFQVVFPASGELDCGTSEVGCEVFGGGQFLANGACDGTPDRDLQQGLIYVNPEKLCVEPEGDYVGNGPAGTVCAYNQIGGCTEEGQRFADVGRCDDVRSQRGYYPTPEDSFETPSDSPLLTDPEYLAELAWVTEQVEACGCVCCHTQSETPEGGSNWVIDSDKAIWTDGFYSTGLAISAGWIDSSLLGAYDPSENNGFGRTISGIPSTDQERMKAFFEGELTRRGYTPEDFAEVDPIPFPFYLQQIYEPEPCGNGEGIARDGTVTWLGGDARYIYLLEEGSEPPLSPPNLDEPEGTLWLLEVYWDEDPMSSGITYPEGPARAEQRYAGPELTEGETYYLYVQADVAAPITRCTFTY